MLSKPSIIVSLNDILFSLSHAVNFFVADGKYSERSLMMNPFIVALLIRIMGCNRGPSGTSVTTAYFMQSFSIRSLVFTPIQIA